VTEHGGGIQNLGADGAERTAIKGFYAGNILIKKRFQSKLIRARILRFALNLFGARYAGCHQ